MRFLDVCRNPAAQGRADHPQPYLLVVQGDHVRVSESCVVIPLVRRDRLGKSVSELMPTLSVLGEDFTLMTPQIAGVRISSVGSVVASLRDCHHEVRRAIDILTGDL